MRREAYKEGFTLIELALSMIFIGLLSISIVLIITNTVSAYRRGLTLTHVNSTGMELVDDIRASVKNSTVRDLASFCDDVESPSERAVCKEDNAQGFVSVVKESEVTMRDGEQYRVPIYGALCTGSNSYIWNSGYFEMEGVSFAEKTNNEWVTFKYLDSAGDIMEVGTERPIRLMKVQDKMRAVCRSALSADGNRYYTTMAATTPDVLGMFDVTNIDYGVLPEDPVELLAANSENALVLYDLKAAKPVESPGNALYSVSFILGTTTGGINIMAKGDICAPPADLENENFSYCAINKFNFTAQVNGE